LRHRVGGVCSCKGVDVGWGGDVGDGGGVGDFLAVVLANAAAAVVGLRIGLVVSAVAVVEGFRRLVGGVGAEVSLFGPCGGGWGGVWLPQLKGFRVWLLMWCWCVGFLLLAVIGVAVADFLAGLSVKAVAGFPHRLGCVFGCCGCCDFGRLRVGRVRNGGAFDDVGGVV
jgi:hypothetical protein